jgi:hypothetical protein
MQRTGPSRRRRAWLIAFLTMAILGGLLALTGSPTSSIAVADETTSTSPSSSSTSSSTSTSTSTTTSSTTTTTVPPGQEGCTPGFWKQPQHLDAWVTYTPGQTLESVFDVPDAFGLDDVTLLEALSLEGGPTTADAAEVLLRQAVAALLNAASPEVDYPLTEAEIIAQVNAALASGDRDTILALAEELDTFNNLFCPLDD